ncbi:MAG: hypothetical protein MK033_02645 [Candidatus Caenarcaniphilales bacterium]|nr:hypothetical protein [Candidatus Caenarcaniphilales bacterium]
MLTSSQELVESELGTNSTAPQARVPDRLQLIKDNLNVGNTNVSNGSLTAINQVSNNNESISDQELADQVIVNLQKQIPNAKEEDLIKAVNILFSEEGDNRWKTMETVNLENINRVRGQSFEDNFNNIMGKYTVDGEVQNIELDSVLSRMKEKYTELANPVIQQLNADPENPQES